MSKKFILSLLCSISAFNLGLSEASAQYGVAQTGEQTGQAQSPMTPDDPRLILMIRNVVIALNQANLTGNYSVLRDMGTPNFQTGNSSARLAEVFATLRARKIDISPIMFFNPKYLTPASLLDGQVLRVAGFFPTTPEQVNFDLAFQLLGEQWMLAGIAVSVTPPGENIQALAAPVQPGRTADSEAKPIRIDLSQPQAPTPVQPVPPKKAAAPKKAKRPPAQQTAAAQPAAPAAALPAPAHPAAQAPAQSDAGPPWNPFGR